MLSNLTKRTNLHILTVGLGLLLFSVHTAFGQLVPISLNERIEKATTILEGKVISQASYWDEAQTHIYTSNVVEVYKVFKGKITVNQVEMITRGGIVNDKRESISNTLELNIGDTGIFTAIDNTAKITTKNALKKLKAFAGIQGFIKYDLINSSAKDVFNEYKSITKELHSKIVTQTKTAVRTIKKTPFKIES